MSAETFRPPTARECGFAEPHLTSIERLKLAIVEQDLSSGREESLERFFQDVPGMREV